MKKSKEEYERETKIRDALLLPEWYQAMSNSSGSCPWCGNMQHWGHTPHCQRHIVAEILEAALGGKVYSDEYSG